MIFRVLYSSFIIFRKIKESMGAYYSLPNSFKIRKLSITGFKLLAVKDLAVADL